MSEKDERWSTPACEEEMDREPKSETRRPLEVEWEKIEKAKNRW